LRGTHISLSWFWCGSSILVELEFGVLVLMEEGKPEKNPRSKVRTNNKLNPHLTSGQNRTWATLVGGQCSHHCAIPAPLERVGRISQQIAQTSQFVTWRKCLVWLSVVFTSYGYSFSFPIPWHFLSSKFELLTVFFRITLHCLHSVTSVLAGSWSVGLTTKCSTQQPAQNKLLT